MSKKLTKEIVDALKLLRSICDNNEYDDCRNCPLAGILECEWVSLYKEYSDSRTDLILKTEPPKFWAIPWNYLGENKPNV